MKRYGMILKIKPEFVSEYIELHKNPNPALLDALTASNIRNNSVFP
jgi:L-rhamnose mutarotase